MPANLSTVDLILRGAAAALLAFHILHALGSRLPPLRRGLLAAFAASILSYVLCSHPAFGQLPNPWWAIALSLCLMAAPLLWLVVGLAFDDRFAWTAGKTALLALAFVAGWMAVGGVGGLLVIAAHKILLIGFALATVWTVAKDWQSDLVAQRRRLRSWVTGVLGVYVLVVLFFELVFIRSAAPQWLMVLNLAGITCVASVTALVFARHPLDEWFLPGIAPLATAVPVMAQAPAVPAARHAALTPEPPTIDRKAALREGVSSFSVQ